jgi:hypothetical protein
MTTLKSFHWKLQPIIGIGAWQDTYKLNVHGFDGWTYNFIIPFVRIQYGVIYLP